MPIYVMHIGPPKAGSTYLQSSLDAVSGPLNEQGVHYQTDWIEPKQGVNHEWMLATLRDGPSPALEAKFAELNNSGYRYVILSTEGFFGLPEDQLQYIKSLAAGAPFIIVYYCRRWSERIPSQWQQLVKSGRYTTFPEHYARELRAPENFLDLNPKLVWDKFAHVFGRQSLCLMPFNTLVENKIDLLDHFLQTLDIHLDARPAPDKIVANESPKAIDTEILRALNYLYFQQTGERSHRVRMNFLSRLKTLNRAPLAEMMKSDLGTIVVDDDSPMFRALYDGMRPYEDCVVPVGGERAFFHAKRRSFQIVHQNYLLQDGAVDLLRAMFAQVDPRLPAPPPRAKLAALAS